MALHERWFLADPGAPIIPGSALEPGALAAVGTAVAVAGGLALVFRATGRRQLIPGPFRLGADHRLLAILYGAIPVVLSLHLAAPLLVSGVQRQLFVPNLHFGGATPEDITVFGLIASLAQIGIGLALFYGAFTRAAAAALAALWMAGALLFGPILLLEHAVLLGTAIALVILGRGPFAVDALLSPRLARPVTRQLALAVPALRIGAGLSLTTLALSEKIWNVPLALRFLEQYPLNFAPAVGVPLSDTAFVYAAGTVELTAGLLLLTNTYVRLGILVLWVPFNLTLALFGWQELVGHLPVYGAMATLALWGGGGSDDLAALSRGISQRPVLLDAEEAAAGAV
jgi:hypothetical protein